MVEAWVQFDLGSFSPGARPIKLRVVQPRFAPLALDVRFSHSLLEPQPFPSLPLADLADRMLEHLMRSCGASAARCALTCKEFADALRRVAARLLDEGIAYWTGMKPPLKPPILYGAIGSKEQDWADVRKKLHHLVRGAGLQDVLVLPRAQWCTNFTIALAVQAAYLQLRTGNMQKVTPLIHDDAPVLAEPRLLDYVLGALIRSAGGPAQFAANHPLWHAQLAAAPYVVCAVNLANRHWASLRVWKHGPAEVFDSMPGSHMEANVQIIIDLLVCLGWEEGKHIHFYSFNHYKQHDSHSCGLITAATLVSLLYNHQLGVASCDLALWKNYFMHSIYCVTYGVDPQVRIAASNHLPFCVPPRFPSLPMALG